jgi:Flp pilus assembly protein TadG
MVTAELAVVLPVLVLALTMCLGAIGVTMARLRCADAAAVAARLAARGESPSTVRRAALAAAPMASGISVTGRDPASVTVVVSTTVRLLGVGRIVPGWSVREVFTAPREPS